MKTFSVASNSPKVKPLPTIVQVREPASVQMSSYWSWTFVITSFPFLFWGCPFYVVTRQPPNNLSLSVITTTWGWFKRMFDCRIFPLACILTFFLLFPTTLLNIYVIYVFCDMFNHLFIAGTYELSMFHDMLAMIRYLPVIIPLNYVWLRGFSVNAMIILLNSIHGRYGGVGCSGVRFRLILMIIAIFGVQIIRYVIYQRYELRDKPFLEAARNSLEFSIDLFCTLLLPLYCTFCYAVRFQLFNVKALVYRLISQRVLPTVTHLDMVKILYTQAADHVVSINDMFSIYLSVALVITLIGTIIDAQNLWGAFLKLNAKYSTSNQLTTILTILAKEVMIGANVTETEDQGGGTPTNETALFTNQNIRAINADVACIVIIYGLIFFTIWQAIGTNDYIRETHVWINDFVTGGGGTDVKSVLQDLGIPAGRSGGDELAILVDHMEEGGGGGLIWARDSILGSGIHDEFLKKFQMLKAYMHVRMQLEKPALLNITLVGLLVPSLSGRLRRYRLMF